jgi:hypothetical protein
MDRLCSLEHGDRGMDVCVRLFCVCVVLCVGSGLVTDIPRPRSPIDCICIKKLKKLAKVRKGSRPIDYIPSSEPFRICILYLTLEITGLWASSSIINNTTFRKQALFMSSGEEVETLTLLGPLERANINPMNPVRLVIGACMIRVVSEEGRGLVLLRTSSCISDDETWTCTYRIELSLRNCGTIHLSLFKIMRLCFIDEKRILVLLLTPKLDEW